MDTSITHEELHRKICGVQKVIDHLEQSVLRVDNNSRVQFRMIIGIVITALLTVVGTTYKAIESNAKLEIRLEAKIETDRTLDVIRQDAMTSLLDTVTKLGIRLNEMESNFGRKMNRHEDRLHANGANGEVR